jgi:hypothetical protein
MRSLRNAIGAVFRRLFWVALVLCGIECTYEEVKARRYKRALDLPTLAGVAISDTLSGAADAEVANADSRRKVIDDKARMLLTLVALLIPVTAALASRLELAWLVLLPLGCFLFAALVLVGYLGIGAGMTPRLSADEAAAAEEDLKRQLVTDAFQSARYNEQCTNFLVDVYRAALRSLMAGLLLVVIVATIAYVRTPDPTRRIIQQLRSDPELIRELRGPQGDRGPAGPPGHTGPPARPAATVIPIPTQPGAAAASRLRLETR